MVLDCQVDSSGSPAPKRPRTKLMGCAEHMELQAAKARDQTEPDPWIARKFAVGLVGGIFFYSYYVFVVRLCVKMVRMSAERLGDRSQGIAYLVVYHILFGMFIWSYTVAIATPPGFAKDYVPQTDPPIEKVELVQVQGYNFDSHLADQPRTSTETSDPLRGSVSYERQLEMHQFPADTEPLDENAGELAPIVNTVAEIFPSTGDTSASPPPSSASTRRPSDSTTTAASASSHPSIPARVASPTPRLSKSSTAKSYINFPPPPAGWEPPRSRPVVERIPIQNPILTEQYRYDAREGIVRPYRSHRCKHCAQVVLKMDHHCPWVGTCVGARNYKYFYNFLQWSTLYTVFLLITLTIANARPLHRARPPIDAQQMVIIGIAFFFSFFTGSLFAAHTSLILRNVTTIEDLAFSRMRQRERSALQRVLGWTNWALKRATRRQWDAEWGRIGREGNLWWLGSARKNWEMVMGQEKAGWFLPIPAKPQSDDGLSYVPNPRFSPEGLWRIRSEWPEHLR